MPFKSKAQQRFMYATKPKGVNLKEWSDKTNFKRIPEKVKKKKKETSKRRSHMNTKEAAAAGLGKRLGSNAVSLIANALGGGVMGAGAGALAADEGEGARGAMYGALAGIPAGILKRMIKSKMYHQAFLPETAPSLIPGLTAGRGVYDSAKYIAGVDTLGGKAKAILDNLNPADLVMGSAASLLPAATLAGGLAGSRAQDNRSELKKKIDSLLSGAAGTARDFSKKL